MAEVNMRIDGTIESVDGSSSLDDRLRGLFAEQRRLRELLEQTRADLDAVNREVLRFQDEHCTDAVREKEYDGALERVLGIDPRIDLNEVEEVLSGKRGCDMGKFIEELETTIRATPSQGAE